MGFGEDVVIFRGPFLQALQPQMRFFQPVPDPDAADPARTDDNPGFLELVGDPDLSVGGILQGILQNPLLDLRRDPVPDPGIGPRLLQQTFDALFLQGGLDVVVMLAADAQFPAGLADVT